MTHGNNQNIFIQQREVASKASACRAETKNSAGSSTGGMGVACLVVVCCCFSGWRLSGPLPPSTGVLDDFQDADQEADRRDRLAGWGRDRECSFPVPAGFGRRGDTPTAPTAARLPYFGRYFLFNAQATENCGSTTLAM